MSAPEPEASLMRSYALILREEEWKNCQQWTAFKKKGVGGRKNKEKESTYPNIDLTARNTVRTEDQQEWSAQTTWGSLWKGLRAHVASDTHCVLSMTPFASLSPIWFWSMGSLRGLRATAFSLTPILCPMKPDAALCQGSRVREGPAWLWFAASHQGHHHQSPKLHSQNWQ